MRAIVTGATSGIGAALTRGLLRDGWTVAGLDRDAGRVDATTLEHAEGRARLEGVSVLGRVGTAEEIAAAIAWLLSPHASFVHGATLVAGGGATMT